MGHRFSHYHPAVSFLYFALVIGFAMALQHPAAQLISLVWAIVYSLQIGGAKGLASAMKFALPLALMTALLNPLLNSQGRTILAILPTGSPLTLESLLYGISAGGMLLTVLVWFGNFNRVITSDKLLALFGKGIPGLSLVVSMTLRFVPRFAGQLRAVAEVQRGLGRDVAKGSPWQRAKTALTVLSVTVTWALENAIITADSMKSRGYGLPGRSSYGIYRFTLRDRLCLGWLIAAGAWLLAGAGCFRFSYFPGLAWEVPTPAARLCWVLYWAMCATPVIIHAWEEIKWNSIHSKI